ncbi:MAG: sigma-54-dependent transcriptional regulator, partial [bacterium]
MSETILIVDDDRGVRYSLKRMIEERGMQTITARNGREAIELLKQGASPDVALIDIVMPGISGLDLLEAIKKDFPRLTVIMVTAHGTTERAIRAMKLGAFDYLQKPFDINAMWATIEKALQVAQSIRNPVSFQTAQWEGESIIGDSVAMQEVYKTIGQIAGKEVNVLITGESGTGKELVARAIYNHSLRNTRPFLSINCAAIPENLLESELFGHERGAYTGAEHRRIGRFEQA